MSARNRLLVVGLSALAGAPFVQAQSSTTTAKVRVAVLDLAGTALRIQTAGQVQPMPGGGYQQQGQTRVTVQVPPPAEFARGLTEALTTLLVRTGQFVVLERQVLQQVQQEQDVGASGRVNKETAAAQGRLIGAQVLITGDITGFTHERTSVGGQLTNVIKGLKASVERVSATVVIDLRLIDATTGEVVASVKGDGSASQAGVGADLVKDEKKYDGSVSLTTPLGLASRQAIQKAVAGIIVGMPKVAWSALVIDVRDGKVYVNAGSKAGVAVGAPYEIFDPQPPLVDPATGKSLGSPDKLIGEIQIESVAEDYAVGKIVHGSAAEFKRSQVVRPKGAGAKP